MERFPEGPRITGLRIVALKALHTDRLREPAMRRRIIEALTYPRILLLANLDGEECAHNLFFNAAHEGCQHCDRSEECRWLNINDEFSVLMQQPMDSLHELLQFCIGYVDAYCTHASHNVRRCACECCYWVRSARRLASDYKYVKRFH